MRTKAKVRVVLEIEVGDTWGPDCKCEQVFKQAAEAAIKSLEYRLRQSDMSGDGIKLVGKPHVDAVLVSE